MSKKFIQAARSHALPVAYTLRPAVRLARLGLLLGLLASTSALFLHAQTGQGALTGRVTDENGAVIRGATVQVTNDETNTVLTRTTNSDGLYDIESLNPGQYSVAVGSPGFEKQVVNAVQISAAQTATVNAELHVGKAAETVTVNAQNALLSTGTSDVTTTVDHKIVVNLPYPERSSLEAALLVPGVTGDPAVPGGIMSENPVITTGPVVPGASISVSGAPPGSSSIVVDGSDVTQASYPRVGISLSGQDVEETTVVTSGLSARYGRTGGGVIVQASKGGANQYHGAITWRHTDPFFNAYPTGTTAADAQHENFYGFYASGPVRIPKIYNGRGTFFFVAFEPARLSNVLGYRGTFLTPAELGGQMHDSLALLNQTILKAQGYAAAVAAPRIGGIYTNSTVNAAGFPNGPRNAALSKEVTGPNGLDDLSAQLAQNPFAQFVLSELPSPSKPGPYIKFDNSEGSYHNDGTNATYERGVQDIDNRYSIRIDQQFNNSNQLFVRYTVVPLSGPRFFALGIDNPLNQVPTDVANSHDIALGYTHVLSNTLVNNFHYSWMRVNQQRTPPASALAKDYAAQYGLTPATLGKGFPILGVLGASTSLQVGNSPSQGNIDQNFIAGDDLTMTVGHHLLQFGGEMRWIQSNQTDSVNLHGGKYAFSATETNSIGAGGGTGGDSLASFILGDIDSYTATPLSVPAYYRWRYDALYFQDDWRIGPRLTLNLGLRWEVEVPRREKFNNQALIRLNTPGTLNGQSTSAAFCFSGSCGLGASLWPTNWHGFEPRIGVSFAPTERTTLRASYGVLRLPLTGYENTPDPDFNVASQTVGNQNGGQTANSTVNYITNPVGPLTSAYTALNGARGPIYSSVGLSPVYVNQTTAVPYTQNYSVTVQYQPAAKTLLQVTYQGLKGTHLIGAFSGASNVPTIATLTSAVQNHVNLSVNAPNPYGIQQNGAVINETNLQQLNPYQNFFNLPLTEIYPRRGTSEYNALYINVNQRYGNGLSLLAYYNWSKSMDNVPDVNTGTTGSFGSAPPQDPTNPYDEWAVSSYDQPSRLKAGFVYELPFGPGREFTSHSGLVNQAIGNISTSGIVTVASGYPNSVILGSTGYFTSFTPSGSQGCAPKAPATFCASSALPSGYTLRPNIVPGVPLINPNWKVNPFANNGGQFTPYLNPAAFTQPGSLNNPRLGNAPRTLTDARSPRETLVDLSVKKGFSFHERYTLNITGQFNDAFNHPVYPGGNSSHALQTAVTNVVTGTTPSITFNPAATSFGNLSAPQTRVIRVGAELVF